MNAFRKYTLTEQQLYNDILNEAGGLEAMMDKAKKRHALARKMDEEYDDLLERYSNQWVAISRDGVVASADSLKGLFAELRGKRTPIEDVYHEFISAETVHYLL